MTVSIKIDADEALKEFKSLIDKVQNRHALMKNIGEILLNGTQDRFKQEQAPNGTRWQPLAPATVRARLKKYGNAPLTILRMRGHLAGSISYTATNDSVKIGANTPYAAIHQLGGKAGRGLKSTIPARPFLGISLADKTSINQAILDHLKSQ